MRNDLLESNRRRASPLGVEQLFGRMVYVQACVFGGGRSLNRYASRHG